MMLGGSTQTLTRSLRGIGSGDDRRPIWAAADRRAAVTALLFGADVAAILLAALMLRVLWSANAPWDGNYWFGMLPAVLLAVQLFGAAGLYDPLRRRSLGATAGWVTLCWLLVAGALALARYLLGLSGAAGATPWPLWLAVSLSVLLTVRLAAWHWLTRLRTGGRLAAATAVLGTPDATRRLVRRLAPALGEEVDLIGTFETADGLLRAARQCRLDDVLVALPWSDGGADETVLPAMLDRLGELPLNVRLVPDLPTADRGPSPAMLPPTVLVVARPLGGWRRVVKRLEDILLSALAILVAGPLMLLIALAIRLESPGPVLFRQQRWGVGALPITVLKFRTMRSDQPDDPGVTQARRGDLRITRVGAFLRQSSLDELPQLFNVLAGDMSLVGPRPHAIPHNEFYVGQIGGYLARHKVKPGITGLAQVKGYRGLTDTLDKMEKRVEYDLAYIERWSLLLDLRILAATVLVGFVHTNAY